MSPNGLRLLHSILSSAMRDALRMELVECNPVALVSPPPKQRREANPPGVTAVREMLALDKAEGDDFFPCIHLIAHTGLRRGEALGLHWQDMDLDAGWLLVGASLVRNGEQGVVLMPPKTRRRRRLVALDGPTVDALRWQRERQDEVKRIMRDSYEDRGAVFAGACGEWLNPAMLARTVKSLGRKGRRTGNDGAETDPLPRLSDAAKPPERYGR